MQRIIQVKGAGQELSIVRQLFREYEKELNADLCFQDFEKEIADPLQKYGMPTGVLLLAYWRDEPAGCIAFTAMEQRGYCEMKRFYVRPGYRGNGLGRILVEQISEFACERGFKVMRLDTLKKLKSAIELYRILGFHNIEPYYHNPLPEVMFMEKNLV